MASDIHHVRRRQLADTLAAKGIRSRAVLDAVAKVPRHLFVPAEYVSDAYVDYPLPIGEGQTISQPYVVAAMSEALALEPGAKVLEVGTGSGYQAAILAELGCDVWSVEVRRDRATQAQLNLSRAGYADRVHQRVGDGGRGWPEAAPFDAIVVTAATPEIPAALLEQLADGGRLLIPVGPEWEQDLVRIVRTGSLLRRESLMAVVFVPLVGAPDA